MTTSTPFFCTEETRLQYNVHLVAQITVLVSFMGCLQSKEAREVAALRSANAEQVKIAAEIMVNHYGNGDFATRLAYWEAGAIEAVVAAMATQRAHPGAFEQLCRVVKEQTMLGYAEQVWYR
jgi:hypothetical protein